MEFKFKSHKLELLYTEQKGARVYGDAVVNAFFKFMAIIASAKDEQDIRAFRSLHYEKLKGDRSHQYSLRLNNQWRLIFEIRQEQGRLVPLRLAVLHRRPAQGVVQFHCLESRHSNLVLAGLRAQPEMHRVLQRI